LPLITWLHLSNTLLGQKWLFSLVLFWPLGGTVRCYLNSSIWFLYKHTINNIFVTRIIKFLNGRWNCFCNGFRPFWNWCDCILWLPNNWCYRFLNDESYLWLMQHESCLILYLYEFGNCLTREFILAFFDSILDHFKGSPQSKFPNIFFI